MGDGLLMGINGTSHGIVMGIYGISWECIGN